MLISSPTVLMLLRRRQFIVRTDRSSCSTGKLNFSSGIDRRRSFSSAFIWEILTYSTNGESCSIRMPALWLMASMGDVVPSVHTSRTSRSRLVS